MPASLAPGNAPGTTAHRNHRGRTPGAARARQWTMTHRARTAAAALAVSAVTALAGCSSGPTYPHAWCGPLVAEFHAKDTWPARQAAYQSAGNAGAPVASLIADESRLYADKAAENEPGTAGYAAVPDAVTAVKKIGADLKALNADCGQPAGAYESDNT
jgi:hypothetical protein